MACTIHVLYITYIDFSHKRSLRPFWRARSLPTWGKKPKEEKKRYGEAFLFPRIWCLDSFFVLEGFPGVWVRAEDSPGGCAKKNLMEVWSTDTTTQRLSRLAGENGVFTILPPLPPPLFVETKKKRKQIGR